LFVEEAGVEAGVETGVETGVGMMTRLVSYFRSRMIVKDSK